MFAIDKYVLKTDIYKPAQFDSYDIPKQRTKDLFRLYDRFEPEIASSQSNINDSTKWKCDKKLHALEIDLLTNKEECICFAKIPIFFFV